MSQPRALANVANLTPIGIETVPSTDFSINNLVVTSAGRVGPAGVSAERLQFTDVSSMTPSLGDVLQYNGLEWSPSTAGATTPVGSALTQTYIWVGDALNTAQEVAMSGDATITNAGVVSLSNTAVTPGVYGSATTSAQIDIDQQGRIISAVDVAISGAGMTALPLNNIYIGDALNVPTPQPVSGDISITTLGATTVNTIQGVDVTMSSATNNISIGNNTANNTGNNNIAIGNGAGNTTTTGFNNIMLGSGATTNAQDCIIMGVGSTVGSGADATICVGRIATVSVNAYNGVCIGYQASLTANSAISIGHLSTGSGIGSTVIGTQAQALAPGGVAVGFNTFATGGKSIAIGSGNGARSGSAIAIRGEVGTSLNTLITVSGTLPVGTISVATTTGFPASGNVYIQTSSNGVQVVAYTGTTATTFTGCAGGLGSFSVGNSADLRGSEGIAIGTNSIVGVAGNGVQGIAIGSQALTLSYRGVSIGCMSSSSGDYTVCIGSGPLSGPRAGTGANCIAIGDAGSNSCTGADNIMIGRDARVFDGAQNVLVGALAGSNTNTSRNVYVGYSACTGALIKEGNVMVGAQAGELMSGSGNVGECVVLGYQSAQNVTAGYQLTAVGFQAGQNSGTGSLKTYIGYQAGRSATGDNNTFVGLQAGQNSGTGTGSTYVGNQAGRSATGSNNTFIGNTAGVGASSVSNVILIGNGAVGGGASNEATVGNSSTTSYRMYAATWTNVSDMRDKKDIKDLDIGLNLLQKVRPVEFVWAMRDGGRKDTRDVGFIAQELQEAQKSAGVNIPSLVNESNSEQLSVGATMLIPVMIKAIQELSAQLEELKSKLMENGIKI